MFLKWILFGSIIASCSMRSESAPINDNIYGEIISKFPFDKIWDKLAVLGRKFVEKLRAFSAILSMFQAPPRITGMSPSKDATKKTPRNDQISEESRPNMLNTISALIDNFSKRINYDRFKREFKPEKAEENSKLKQ